MVQAVANQMAKQESPKGGAIVAVSSISALMGGGEQCHYTPTKAGVKSLMESCAIALGPMGIRCNSVLPGMSAPTFSLICRNYRDEHQQRRFSRSSQTSGPRTSSTAREIRNARGFSWSRFVLGIRCGGVC